MNTRLVIMTAKGFIAYIPGLDWLRYRGKGSPFSARYCYTVWLRHLVMARQNGLTSIPSAVAELGPGGSLGTGLAALLSGAQRYVALDVVPLAHADKNTQVFDELLQLFRKREPIPHEAEFAGTKPVLPSYEFPRQILTDEVLDRAMADDRVREMRRAVAGLSEVRGHNVWISYYCPWYDPQVVQPETVDFLFSQAVMQSIDYIEHAYKAIHQWLKAGGMTSHQIDLTSRQSSDRWNGHWLYSDRTWKLLRGGRAFLTNRLPRSGHIQLLKNTGCEIVCDIPTRRESEIDRKALAPRFRDLSDDDLTTAGCFIQAVKRHEGPVGRKRMS